MKNTLSVAALALALSVAFSSTAATTGASATAGEPFTPAQQARIGEIAADYLVDAVITKRAGSVVAAGCAGLHDLSQRDLPLGA